MSVVVNFIPIMFESKSVPVRLVNVNFAPQVNLYKPRSFQSERALQVVADLSSLYDADSKNNWLLS